MAGWSPRGDVPCGLSTPTVACRSGPPRARTRSCSAGISPTRPAASASACTAPTTPRTRRTGCAASRCSARSCRTRRRHGFLAAGPSDPGLPVGRLHGQARARLHLPGGRLGGTPGALTPLADVSGGRADRGRGRRCARDLVQPGRRRDRRRTSSGSGSSPRRSGRARTTRRSPGCPAGWARRSSGSPAARERSRVGAARRVLRVHLGTGLAALPRPAPPAPTYSWSCTAGTATRPARTRRHRPRPTTTRRCTRPGSDDARHLADGAEQERAAAQQVPGADHGRRARAVWTGSTNLTQGAVFGHLNVGHLIRDPAVAQRFLDYWAQLADQTVTTGGAAAVDRVDQPGRPGRPGGIATGPLAAGDHQPAARLVRRRVRRR